MSDLLFTIGVDMTAFNAAIDKAVADAKRIGSKMQDAGKKLTVGLTAPLTALGTVAVSNTIKFEKLGKSLDVLAGSAEEGARAFERIKQFSAATPFQLGDLVQVNNTLMGFGQNVDEAFNSLQMLADISAITGSDLNRVAVAFGQSAAAGRVMTQDLNQFINNGIPIYELLGEVTGQNVGELRDLARQGEITFELLNQAFTKATSEGGKFFEVTKQLSQTLGGQLSTLRDNFALLMADFGQVIGSVLSPMIKRLTSLMQRFRALSPEVKKVIVVVAALAAAIGPLLIAIGTLATTVLPALAAAFTFLTGPIGLVVAALGALTYIIIDNWSEVKNLIVDVVNGFVDLYNESVVFRAVVEAIALQFKNTMDVGVFALKTIWGAVKLSVKNIIQRFTDLGKIVTAVLKGDFSKIPEIIKDGFNESKDVFGEFIDKTEADFKKLTENIYDNVKEGVERVKHGKMEKITADDLFDIDFSNIFNFGGGAGESSKGVASLTQEVQAQTVALVDATSAWGRYHAELAESDAQFENSLSNVNNWSEGISQAAGAVRSAFGAMGRSISQSLGLAETGMQGFLRVMIDGATQILAMALSNSLAKAIEGGANAGAMTGAAAPFTTPAFISTMVGTVISAFAAIPSFSDGGVYSGNPFGDLNLARVNGNEMFLNTGQQKNLFDMIDKGGVSGISGTVNIQGGFDLKGNTLNTAVERADLVKQRRTRGF